MWPGDPSVTQPFGRTSLTVEPYWQQAQCHWHCGIDIGLFKYTPLYAARGGQVVEVSYGILGIRPTNRTETDYYVHIDSAVVGWGQQVGTTQLIGYSGDKVPSGGYLTGPHLHFEVNTGGLNEPASSIDPVPVLLQSGTLIDMTPDESRMLKELHDGWLTTTATPTANNATLLDTWILLQKAVKDIQAKVAAIGPPGGSGGLTAVQAQALQQAATDIAAVRARIEKDLAP